MRGFLLTAALLAAALLLVVPSPVRADEEPRADGDVRGVLIFECGPQRWVIDDVAVFTDSVDLLLLARLVDQFRNRGFRATPATQARLAFFGVLKWPDLDVLGALRRTSVPRLPRPSGRREDARWAAMFALGPARFEALLIDQDDDRHAIEELGQLRVQFEGRGWRFQGVVEWEEPAATPAERDAAALVAGDGKLPVGYVPAGKQAPGEIPPLSVLGGTVVLELVDGEARARVTAAPEGSRARKMGLREGDAILEVDGVKAGPRVLLGLDEPGAAAFQHGLKVRRTQGGIERIVIDSWERPPPAR